MSVALEFPTVIAESRCPAGLKRRRLNSGKYRRINGGDLEKRCPKCRMYCPADNVFFYASKHLPDGLYDWCKACYLDWRAEHKKRRA